MIIQRSIFLVLLFIIRPVISQGNDGSGSANRFRHMPGIYKMRMVADTIPETKPETKKPEENAPVTVKPEIIKEVPRSRRQVKPIPLPAVPIKPIKIIKPKIIRRTLGVIG
jgi:hypothetical protein